MDKFDYIKLAMKAREKKNESKNTTDVFYYLGMAHAYEDMASDRVPDCLKDD